MEQTGGLFNMSFINSLTQAVVADSLNSSISNLSAGASFVGVAVDDTSFAGIQVTFKCDQNSYIYVDQATMLGNGVGTVTTNGTITLNGASTKFLSMKVGDQIYVTGETVRVIASISSDTVLTVTSPFSTSVGSLIYRIYYWDVSDVFEYNVIKDNFGQTIQAVSQFYRIRVTNRSTTTATTYFRLQTVLVPIIEALPRTLDNYGSLKTTVKGLSDTFGFSGQFTPMRDLKTITPIRLIGNVFGSAIDTNFWTATNTGTSSASGVANSLATMTSGTSTNGYGQLQTVRLIRYQFGHPLQFRGLYRVPVLAVSQNTRRWGPFSVSTTTPTNGVYFEIDPAGVLSVNTVSNGSVNKITSGAFNGDVSEYIMDTNVHAYEIIYYTAAAYFLIDNILIHTVIPTTSVLYKNLDVPITVTSINSGTGTASGSIECWNATVFKLGNLITAPTYKFQAGLTTANLLKAGSGALHSVAISSATSGAVVTLYDNTTATVPVIWSSTITFGNQGGNGIYTIDFGGISFYTGLTLSITTQAASVFVKYE